MSLVTVNDNDTAGVTITPTTLTVTEGGEQTYTVELDTAPAGAVTVAIDYGHRRDGTDHGYPAFPQF